ncbi:MAG: sigma-70 family RNA polymerase sigma factor, partial [Armatimonadota bacterium]
GWLRTVTQNKIRDFFRRQRGKPLASGGTAALEQLAQLAEEPPTTASGGPPCTELLRLRRRAVEIVQAGVEERTWQAFWRVVVEGRSVSEVAEELGLSSQAVYDAKYRLRRKLRQELEGLTE